MTPLPPNSRKAPLNSHSRPLKNIGETLEAARYLSYGLKRVKAAQKSSSCGLNECVVPVLNDILVTQVMLQRSANAGGLR
jgi:hypothetical protein